MIGEVSSDEPLMFEDTDVLPGHSYYYRVRLAHRAHGETSFSNTAVVDMPSVPAPYMVDASRGERDRITVRVNPAFDDGHADVHHSVWRTEANQYNDASYQQLSGHLTWDGGDLLYEDTDVIEGRWYYYKARTSVGHEGIESSLSPGYAAGYAGEFAPEQPPPTPQDFSVEGRDWDSSIGVKWRPVSNAERYRVHRLAFDGSIDPNVDPPLSSFAMLFEGTRDDFHVVHSQGQEFLEHRDSDTESGRLYSYYMTAINQNGESPPTRVQSASFGEEGVPGRPEISATDGDFSNAVVVSWAAVNRGDWYQVYRVSGGEIAEALSPWIRETSFVYYTSADVFVSVKARSDKGIVGPESNRVVGRVDNDAPEYSEPDNGNGEDDLEYEWNDLGDVPVSTGERVIIAMDGTESDGTIHIAVLEDPAFAYEYGTPFVMELSGGQWSALPDLPEEIMGSSTVGTGIRLSSGSHRVVFSAYDDDKAYIHEHHDGTWSENLAEDHFGYASRPASLAAVMYDGEVHVAIETPDQGNLRVLRRSGGAWHGVGDDGYVTSNQDISSITLDVLGDALYLSYVIEDEVGDEGTLLVQSHSSLGWQTELTWTMESIGRPQLARAPDGTLYFRASAVGMDPDLGGVFEVTSPTTAEGIRPDWCADSFSIAVDSSGRLVLACMFWDMDVEHMAYPVVGVYDGEWNRIAGDFSGGSRPVDLQTIGSDIYYVFGDVYSIPELRSMPTVLRSASFSLQ